MFSVIHSIFVYLSAVYIGFDLYVVFLTLVIRMKIKVIRTD